MNESEQLPGDDLAYIRKVMERTHRAVDPHAFHFIIWGALVAVAYPVLNVLQLQGWLAAMAWFGGSVLLLGAIVSMTMELRLLSRPRLRSENTFVGRQIGWIVAANVLVGFALSALGPATGVLRGEHVPIIWGFLYANMAWMIGIVYTPEHRWSGLVICVVSFTAMLRPEYAGFVLAPAMSAGMIVPGILAERRVAHLRKDETADGV